jgi:HrpA-like RNA helicase
MNSLFPATQVPQFILDDPEMGPTCNIIITQPRRISAMSVAERVASERCENLGQCIGYTVRLDSCCSTRTQCLFVTPGVLLRKLQSNPTLDGFTHIILDEVHERDRYSEFLMICLKDILSNKQTSLKVVLMSATLQTQELVDYWRGAGISANNEHNHPEQYYTAPPEVNIPGRTYPVQVFFLEDILGMTGFVDDHYRNNYMAQLDKDLSKLMQSTTFTCNMCNKSGFRSPEEFGTHTATCVGDPALSMAELEFNLRTVDGNSSLTEDKASEYDVNIEQDGQEKSEEKYDDDGNLIPSLWDGVVNFADFSCVQRTTTLTEEEMLMRYQTTHDDENIDEELILAICHYIIQSSYGDGAILIFFPGWIEISEFLILLESTMFTVSSQGKSWEKAQQ